MSLEWTEPPLLPGWLEAELPFPRRMARVGGRNMHLIDEGEGRPVLLLHGNPTWSYLWRKVCSQLVGHNLRLVVPDLIGFGLSEKLPRTKDHSLEFHTTTLEELVVGMDLQDLIVVGQDWGGPIVGGMAARQPHRVTAGVFANTALLMPKRPIRTTWFHRLSHWPVLAPALFYGTAFPVPILHRVQGDPASIGAKEKRAYHYPFRRLTDRAGPLALARMVPNRDDHPSMPQLESLDRWTRSFRGHVSLVWGLRDPILGRALYRLRDVWPQAQVVETQGGHFLQEEVPDLIAGEILRVAGAEPSSRRE